jgi:ribosomal protein S18 acetylase RimI-like enzyme
MSGDQAHPNLVIRRFRHTDTDAVVELWQKCGLTRPWNNPYEDIALKMDFQPELFFVGTLGSRVVAAVMVGYEGHRGWIQYLGVSPDCQRQGIGSSIVAAAETALRELGCVKINLQVRETNQAVIAFYESLGFSSDHVIGLGKRLKPAKEQP